MPFPIKMTLTVIVILAAAGAYLFQDSIGQVGPKYAVLFLGVFMAVAMWVFPEVTRKGSDRRGQR
ncbi:hypothetical protein N825_08635 [Skermanella stibiiresistens SB22]|uniref:Uncharacterized protein n=1 Tax=Skermanella stibiiresistens SB22 TaxID=1385369 RepID=W9GZ04_9PROT|nr:hypothetical protein [Skermanella stibiiresistens]EWY39059.1 hypothetical protein N825_08635 [Skermanella stibiiresistens SB22]